MLRALANGETFVSATMCPQQCVLVCQGLKDTKQCPRPGLEPGPLDPETSALTMRPPRLHTIEVTFTSCRAVLIPKRKAEIYLSDNLNLQ